jgi:hypothetical protein
MARIDTDKTRTKCKNEIGINHGFGQIPERMVMGIGNPECLDFRTGIRIFAIERN